MDDLVAITNAKVPHEELSLYFFNHFKHDVYLISQAIGKNVEDVCLLLHLILKMFTDASVRVTCDSECIACLMVQHHHAA